jgi:hypothetical protein
METQNAWEINQTAGVFEALYGGTSRGRFETWAEAMEFICREAGGDDSHETALGAHPWF